MTTGNDCRPCHLDVIGKHECSVVDIANKKRQRQRRVGHELARKRMLQHAISTSTLHNSSDAAYPTAVLSHHRPGRGELYLTGDSAQYSSCAFLDSHELILAADLHGDVNVLRLPRYNAENNDKKNDTGANCITELAGRLRLSESDSSYSVTSKYKLKSLQNGQAFAIGTPSGSFSTFATEHGSTWCNDGIPQHCQRRLRQENLSRNNKNHDNFRDWMPYITRGWEIDSLQRILPDFHDNSIIDGPNDWWLKPHGDALWDFRETPSSLLAVHAPYNFSGWSHNIRFMDSRTPSSVQCVDILNNKSAQRPQPQGITATCFASDVSIVTATARMCGDRSINNVIQTWDLRKLGTFLAETPVSDPSLQRDSRECRKYFLSYLTPSASGNGQVMATSASLHNHTTVQHFWFDLGRQEIVGDEGNICIHQPNRNTTVFATNPIQDFMVCYDSTPNTNILRLYDLQQSRKRAFPSKELDCREAKTKVTVPLKRKLNQDGLIRRNLSSSKISRRQQENDTPSTSSTSDTDDSSDAEEEEPVQYPGMIPCMGQFKPRLCDCHGLSTTLSCLAVNDTGTAIIGGSFDGDVFAWRGP